MAVENKPETRQTPLFETDKETGNLTHVAGKTIKEIQEQSQSIPSCVTPVDQMPYYLRGLQRGTYVSYTEKDN